MVLAAVVLIATHAIAALFGYRRGLRDGVDGAIDLAFAPTDEKL